MQVTYQINNYKSELVHRRYVRKDKDAYRWCEVGDNPLYDLRQGIAVLDDVPLFVRTEADAIAGNFPSYVDWPI